MEKLCNKSKQDRWNAKCYNILDISVTLSYLKHWRPKRYIDYIADLFRTRKLYIFYSTQCSPLLLKLFHTDFNKSKPMAYLFLVFLVCCMEKFILTSFHWVCLSGFPPQRWEVELSIIPHEEALSKRGTFFRLLRHVKGRKFHRLRYIKGW